MMSSSCSNRTLLSKTRTRGNLWSWFNYFSSEPLFDDRDGCIYRPQSLFVLDYTLLAGISCNTGLDCTWFDAMYLIGMYWFALVVRCVLNSTPILQEGCKKIGGKFLENGKNKDCSCKAFPQGLLLWGGRAVYHPRNPFWMHFPIRPPFPPNWTPFTHLLILPPLPQMVSSAYLHPSQTQIIRERMKMRMTIVTITIMTITIFEVQPLLSKPQSNSHNPNLRTK